MKRKNQKYRNGKKVQQMQRMLVVTVMAGGAYHNLVRKNRFAVVVAVVGAGGREVMGVSAGRVGWMEGYLSEFRAHYALHIPAIGRLIFLAAYRDFNACSHNHVSKNAQHL